MKTVPLIGKRAAGRVALIDDKDWPLVTGHAWRVLEYERNGKKKGPYALTDTGSGDGRLVTMYMHKLITGYPMTDHIDHDGLNNQRFNLRPATHAQNLHNQRLRNGTSSRYKGVCWHGRCHKWQAGLTIDSRYIYLGLYAREEEAALAYNTAALEAFGAYAYLNPVDGRPEVPAA